MDARFVLRVQLYTQHKARIHREQSPILKQTFSCFTSINETLHIAQIAAIAGGMTRKRAYK